MIKYYKIDENGSIQSSPYSFDGAQELDISTEDAQWLRKINGQIIIDEQAKAAVKLEVENHKRIAEIKTRLTALSEDIVQDQAGEVVPDIEARKTEFVALHNELRKLLGKEPRAVK